jgi:hypothetical protein
VVAVNAPPDFAIQLAERRTAGMLHAYQRRQSAPPSLAPIPTLRDLVVSAYLQGVNDTVDAADAAEGGE